MKSGRLLMNVAFSLDKKAISAELKVHQYAEGDLAGLRNLEHFHADRIWACCKVCGKSAPWLGC